MSDALLVTDVWIIRIPVVSTFLLSSLLEHCWVRLHLWAMPSPCRPQPNFSRPPWQQVQLADATVTALFLTPFKQNAGGTSVIRLTNRAKNLWANRHIWCQKKELIKPWTNTDGNDFHFPFLHDNENTWRIKLTGCTTDINKHLTTRNSSITPFVVQWNVFSPLLDWITALARGQSTCHNRWRTGISNYATNCCFLSRWTVTASWLLYWNMSMMQC